MTRIAKRNLDDVAELMVAAWLVASPFVLGYSANIEATLCAVFIGSVLGFTSQFALARPAKWEEYMNLVLGLFLIASPFIFKFSMLATATVNSMAMGIILVMLCAAALFHQRYLDREGRTEREAKPATLTI